MNIILNPTQSDTKRGDIQIIATVNLTGLEGRLAKLVSNGEGPALAALPTALTDLAFYVIASGDIAGNPVNIETPGTDDEFRVVAKGTGTAGSLVVLADPNASSGADAGKVTALGSTAGQYFSPGIAEEDYIDGQLVKCRFIPRLVRIGTSITLTSATVATTTATNSSPYGYSQAQANAIVTELNAVVADVAAIKTALNAQGITQ
ncbi:MAG: hypothetical protein WCD79_17900 [Chthoniobacteraceae bacterium]